MKGLKVSVEKLAPELDMFTKEELKWYCPETNTRTKTTFIYELPIADSREEYDINFARNQIFINQYRLPMKYLKPALDNCYISQKCPLLKESDNIKNAAITIEPLNIGFDEYIRCIPIDQNLEIGTVFSGYIKVPYEDTQRHFFKSSFLLPEEQEGPLPFDPNIKIGSLDIGSEYTAKFIVTQVDQGLYDSYTKFTFRCTDNSFSIITYDFMHVSVKQIIEEVLKICENTLKDKQELKPTETILKQFIDTCKI